MSLDDAKKILTGGDNSVTEFFKNKTEGPLTVKFLPIVKQATDRVGLAKQYDEVAGQGAKFGSGQGRRDQHRSIRHTQSVGWSISHDRRGRAGDPAKSGSGRQRDRLKGFRRFALRRTLVRCIRSFPVRPRRAREAYVDNYWRR